MKELNIIQTSLNAPKGQFNAFGKYKYRSCEDILQAVKPLLKETETILLLSDDITEVAGRVFVKAVASLKNKEGHAEIVTAYAELPTTKKGMDLSQITGASSSYARKYALNGLFAIDDNKDADTNSNLIEKALKDIGAAETEQDLKIIWNDYKQLQNNEDFKTQITKAKKSLL